MIIAIELLHLMHLDICIHQDIHEIHNNVEELEWLYQYQYHPLLQYQYLYFCDDQLERQGPYWTDHCCYWWWWLLSCYHYHSRHRRRCRCRRRVGLGISISFSPQNNLIERYGNSVDSDTSLILFSLRMTMINCRPNV